MRQEVDLRERFRGCLLAGAAGDALGGVVELHSRAEILDHFGPAGIRDYSLAYGGRGRITDDTQMTLFTAEGLIRAHLRGYLKGVTRFPSVISRAYERWYRTQTRSPDGNDDRPPSPPDGWLTSHDELHERRGPGKTCLSALSRMTHYGEPAQNQSKGCGAIMRVAPVGLYFQEPKETQLLCAAAFEQGVSSAALTHGHPTAQLAAGVMAVVIQRVVAGDTLSDAIQCARRCLLTYPQKDHAETENALSQALALSRTPSLMEDPHEAIPQLGLGWVAEETLAIALYACLVAPNLEEAVCLAVNHDGDSDSTGALAGQIMGAMHGTDAIPARWLEPLELRDTISEIADDLLDCHDWQLQTGREGRVFMDYLMKKYPAS